MNAQSLRDPRADSAAVDPAVALGAEVREAEAAWNAATDAVDEVEAERWKHCVPMPAVLAGRCHCVSEDGIRGHCQPNDPSGPNPAERDRLIALFRDQKARYRLAREKAGLKELDEANEAARARWHAVMKSIATTPATTAAGLAVKLRFIVEGFADGNTAYDQEIAQGALQDAERLAGEGGAS